MNKTFLKLLLPLLLLVSCNQNVGKNPIPIQTPPQTLFPAPTPKPGAEIAKYDGTWKFYDHDSVTFNRGVYTEHLGYNRVGMIENITNNTIRLTPTLIQAEDSLKYTTLDQYLISLREEHKRLGKSKTEIDKIINSLSKTMMAPKLYTWSLSEDVKKLTLINDGYPAVYHKWFGNLDLLLIY